MTEADGTHRVTVDGEVFEVTQRGGSDTFDFAWVSGPHEGYGFSSFAHLAFEREGETAPPPRPRDEAWMTEAIRNFLRQVDPETGYLG